MSFSFSLVGTGLEGTLNLGLCGAESFELDLDNSTLIDFVLRYKLKKNGTGEYFGQKNRYSGQKSTLFSSLPGQLYHVKILPYGMSLRLGNRMSVGNIFKMQLVS